MSERPGSSGAALAPLTSLLLAIFCPLAALLLVCYVRHWCQVVARLDRQQDQRDPTRLQIRPRPAAMAMLSIRQLEKETGGRFHDLAVDTHDEYGLEISRDSKVPHKKTVFPLQLNKTMKG